MLIWDHFGRDVEPGDVIVYPRIHHQSAAIAQAVFCKQTEKGEDHLGEMKTSWQIAVISERTRYGYHGDTPDENRKTTQYSMQLLTLQQASTECILVAKGGDIEAIRDLISHPPLMDGNDVDPFIVMQKMIYQQGGANFKCRGMGSYVESWSGFGRD